MGPKDETSPALRGKDVPFSYVCKIYDALGSKKQKRNVLIANVLTVIRNSFRDDPALGFGFFRLLVPSADENRRQKYGLRESGLAKLMSGGIPGLSESERDRIKRYKNHSSRHGSGDCPSVIRDVVQSYDVPRDTSEADLSSVPTVLEVNMLLDRLIETKKQDDRIVLLRDFGTKKIVLSIEWYWICRLILLDLKIRVSPKSIFKGWHPQAFRVYSINQCLQQVYDLDPNVDVDPTELIAVSLGQPIKPMVAEDWLGMREKVLNFDKDMFVEMKYDGFRVQIHKNGTNVDFFTRGLANFNEEFNSVVPSVLASLSGCESGIFDCEAMAYTTESGTEELIDRALIRSAGLAITRGESIVGGSGSTKTVFQTSKIFLRFYVFDILMLEGETLLQKPLEDRKEILDSVVIDTKGLRNSPYERLNHEEVFARFEEASLRGDEGLMLKRPRSHYAPSERNKGWMKMKVDRQTKREFDCVVVGYSKGSGIAHQSRNAASLVVAVVDNESRGTPTFITVGRVGNQNDNVSFLRTLEAIAFPYMPGPDGRYPLRVVEAEYRIELGVMKAEDRPTFLLNPLKSVVVTVETNSMTPCQWTPCGFSFLFPKFRGVKETYDRNPLSAMTIDEITEVFNSTNEQGRLMSLTSTNTHSLPTEKKRSFSNFKKLQSMNISFNHNNTQANSVNLTQDFSQNLFAHNNMIDTQSMGMDFPLKAQKTGKRRKTPKKRLNAVDRFFKENFQENQLIEKVSLFSYKKVYISNKVRTSDMQELMTAIRGGEGEIVMAIHLADIICSPTWDAQLRQYVKENTSIPIFKPDFFIRRWKKKEFTDLTLIDFLHLSSDMLAMLEEIGGRFLDSYKNLFTLDDIESFLSHEQLKKRVEEYNVELCNEENWDTFQSFEIENAPYFGLRVYAKCDLPDSVSISLAMHGVVIVENRKAADYIITGSHVPMPKHVYILDFLEKLLNGSLIFKHDENQVQQKEMPTCAPCTIGASLMASSSHSIFDSDSDEEI
ncbi:hypothetical protein PCE1_002979 [Barthelona sp. PCE]